MWTCPKCERVFKTAHQSHYCGLTTLDELFAKSPPHLVLAFDRLIAAVIDWEPCSLGAAKKAVVFSSHKAWLVVRPMTKVLDLKFYCDRKLSSPEIFKVQAWGKKYAHHIRIQDASELTLEVLRLLREGHRFSMQ